MTAHGAARAVRALTALDGFEPGFGTHGVEHRALDFAGNHGPVEEFRATVLPGGDPECTSTVGNRNGRLTISSGVGVAGRVNGGVTVRPRASLVLRDGSRINGGLTATDLPSSMSSGRASTATRASRAPMTSPSPALISADQ